MGELRLARRPPEDRLAVVEELGAYRVPLSELAVDAGEVRTAQHLAGEVIPNRLVGPGQRLAVRDVGPETVDLLARQQREARLGLHPLAVGLVDEETLLRVHVGDLRGKRRLHLFLLR